MLQLSIKPKPYTEEAPIGYALRLAQLNGYQYIRSMIATKHSTRLSKFQESGITIIDDAISFDKLTINTQVNNPLCKFNLTTEPKICLDCIHESMLIHTEHQSPFSYYCNKHRTPLIDCCPSCNQKLNWDLPLMRGYCTNGQCGLELTYTGEPKVPLSLPIKNISDCLLAGHIIRLDGNISITQTKWMSLPNHLQLIEEGYAFLTNKKIARRWQQSKLEKYAHYFPLSFATISSLLLMQNLNDVNWPALQLGVKKQSTVKRSTTPPSIVTTAGIATSLFNVQLFQLRALHDLNILTILDNSRLSSHTPVEVTEVFKKLSLEAVTPEMKPIAKQVSTLTYYDISMTTLLTAIINGELPYSYHPSEDILSSLFVRPKHLQIYAKQYFKARSGNKITLDKAVALTGLSKRELTKLRDDNVLKKPDWFRKGGNFFCLFEDIVKLRKLPQHKQLTLEL
jgi:hypothetical protein